MSWATYHGEIKKIGTSRLILLRPVLHQVSASMLWQLFDDANNPFLIENNGVTPEWGCNRFPSDSIILNKNRIGSVIAEWS